MYSQHLSCLKRLSNIESGCGNGFVRDAACHSGTAFLLQPTGRRCSKYYGIIPRPLGFKDDPFLYRYIVVRSDKPQVSENSTAGGCPRSANFTQVSTALFIANQLINGVSSTHDIVQGKRCVRLTLPACTFSLK